MTLRGSDIIPFPNMLVAYTATAMSAVGGQDEEESSNMWLQTSPSQEEAGMVADPQWLPEVESE